MHRILLALLTTLTLLTPAFAHQSTIVGEGTTQYRVIFGMTHEPIFTNERNALDLIIRTAAGAPVEGLAASLSVTITAPNGATRDFTLRPQYGKPGYYTDDLLLTEPGVYQVRIHGFIGELAVDVTFDTHMVRPLADLAFP
jgi:hypothetical protein